MRRLINGATKIDTTVQCTVYIVGDKRHVVKGERESQRLVDKKRHGVKGKLDAYMRHGNHVE